jgi:natural product precursor
MKAKEFEKKLGLNKITISNLNTDEMNAIRGGDDCQTQGTTFLIFYCCDPTTGGKIMTNKPSNTCG